MSRKISTISVVLSNKGVTSGNFTTVDIVFSEGEWKEENPARQKIKITETGFELTFENNTFSFMINGELLKEVHKAIMKADEGEEFAEPKKVVDSKGQPSWLAYARETIPIVCSIGNWVLRPGLRWKNPDDQTAEKIALINQRTSGERYVPKTKVKLV